MTKASTVTDSWVKELKCAICLEQYKEPKVLPCLHSFCKTCLEGLLPKEGLSWRVDCPSCCSSVEMVRWNMWSAEYEDEECEKCGVWKVWNENNGRQTKPEQNHAS